MVTSEQLTEKLRKLKKEEKKIQKLRKVNISDKQVNRWCCLVELIPELENWIDFLSEVESNKIKLSSESISLRDTNEELKSLLKYIESNDCNEDKILMIKNSIKNIIK
jgi:hypothetical protein